MHNIWSYSWREKFVRSLAAEDDEREMCLRSENNVAVRWYGGISSFAILETVKPIVVLPHASDKYDELSPLERATLGRVSSRRGKIRSGRSHVSHRWSSSTTEWSLFANASGEVRSAGASRSRKLINGIHPPLTSSRNSFVLRYIDTDTC